MCLRPVHSHGHKNNLSTYVSGKINDYFGTSQHSRKSSLSFPLGRDGSKLQRLKNVSPTKGRASNMIELESPLKRRPSIEIFRAKMNNRRKNKLLGTEMRTIIELLEKHPVNPHKDTLDSMDSPNIYGIDESPESKSRKRYKQERGDRPHSEMRCKEISLMNPAENKLYGHRGLGERNQIDHSESSIFTSFSTFNEDTNKLTAAKSVNVTPPFPPSPPHINLRKVETEGGGGRHTPYDDGMEILSPCLKRIGQKKRMSLLTHGLILSAQRGEESAGSASPFSPERKEESQMWGQHAPGTPNISEIVTYEQDSSIIELIAKEILFEKEKELFTKYLLSKHEYEEFNLRRLIITRYLNENKNREKLLEDSLLRYFVLQDEKKKREKCFKKLLGSEKAKQPPVLASLEALPEVIQACHIRVPKEYDSNYMSHKQKKEQEHRILMKDMISLNLRNRKNKQEKSENLGVIKYIIGFKNREFLMKGIKERMLLFGIVNLRKIFATLSTYNDVDFAQINSVKWNKFIQKLGNYANKGFFDISFDTIFDIVSVKKKNNYGIMNFPEFQEAILLIGKQYSGGSPQIHDEVALNNIENLLENAIKPYFNNECKDFIYILSESKHIKIFFEKNEGFFKNLLDCALSIPTYEKIGNSQGIVQLQFLEFCKIIGIYPMALSKNEVIRIFMTSLKDEEWMGKREFYLSLLYIADSQINLNRDSSIPKAFARLRKYFFVHATHFGEEKGLKKLKILADARNKKTLQGRKSISKHYSATLK